uniref:Uncharacterized protein n=1 Tax=Romanomermis culicivorax TaxID=13658 RepID=A0A915KJM7_ROMCU
MLTHLFSRREITLPPGHRQDGLQIEPTAIIDFFDELNFSWQVLLVKFRKFSHVNGSHAGGQSSKVEPSIVQPRIQQAVTSGSPCLDVIAAVDCGELLRSSASARQSNLVLLSSFIIGGGVSEAIRKWTKDDNCYRHARTLNGVTEPFDDDIFVWRDLQLDEDHDRILYYAYLIHNIEA